MKVFNKKLSSFVLCGALVLAIVPESTGLSKSGGVFSGDSLNDMSGTNFGLQKDNGKNADYESTGSEKSNGDKEKKSEEPKNSGVIHKDEDKVGTVFLSGKKENESGDTAPSKTESLLKDAAKVGSGLGAGALGLKGAQIAVNKAKGKDKQSILENTGYSEDIERVNNRAEEAERERDESLAREKAANDALPEKSRVWLFWVWGYLFKHFGIFGEGKKGVGLFAEHDKGTRITMLVFNSILALISLLFVVFTAKSYGVKWPYFFVPGVIFSPLIAFLPTMITDFVYFIKKEGEEKKKKNGESEKNLSSTNNVVN